MTSWGRCDFIETYGLAEEKVWRRSGRLGAPGVSGPDPGGARGDALEPLAARLLPPLPSPALAPQEPPAAPRRAGAGSRADTGSRSRWSARGPRPRPSTAFATGLATSASPRPRSFPASSAPSSSGASTSWPPLSSSPAASRAGACRSARRSPPGLPVASSTATGLPDVVGDAGLLFDPEDDGRDRRLRAAPLDRRAACGDLAARGRERSERFSFDRTARLFRAHYRRIGGQRRCQRKTVSFWRPRPRPERRPFDRRGQPLSTTSAASPRSSAPWWPCSPGEAGSLGSCLQVVFRDQLGDISRQTQRLGSASVESVTYLGSEVRALDQRLAAIERELAALRELLERQEPVRRPGAPRRSQPAHPQAEMASVPPGSVWLDARGTQSVGHAERGIARYVSRARASPARARARGDRPGRPQPGRAAARPSRSRCSTRARPPGRPRSEGRTARPRRSTT